AAAARGDLRSRGDRAERGGVGPRCGTVERVPVRATPGGWTALCSVPREGPVGGDVPSRLPAGRPGGSADRGAPRLAGRGARLGISARAARGRAPASGQ